MWDNLMFLVVLAFSGLMICGITIIMVLSHIHIVQGTQSLWTSIGISSSRLL